jgi:hypothetical protein
MLPTRLQWPLDRAGFSWRICPSCALDFKVRGTWRDAGVLTNAFADLLPHANCDELEPSGGPRHCPYCGATHEADAWWTSSQRRWLERQARHLADEIRWLWMQLPFDRLGQYPRPTYLRVPPLAAPEPGPEEDREHLVAVPLPCCGEEIQIAEGWVVPVRCHYCGIVYARQAMAAFGHELDRAGAWRGRNRSLDRGDQ